MPPEIDESPGPNVHDMWHTAPWPAKVLIGWLAAMAALCGAWALGKMLGAVADAWDWVG